jgi:AcrR family transcriptional regulator
MLGSPQMAESLTGSIARRSLERSSVERIAAYEEEVRAIVDATYRVIERTDSFDPTLRDILTESGLSNQAFYKHFRSKDELLLLLLDDGRRRLLGYLEHRMDKASTPAGRIRAWIEGVLAQAADREAAARTRPFLAHRERLAEMFPDEQQASVGALIDLLASAVSALPGWARRDRRHVDSAATAVYDVTFGALHRYLRDRTKPSAADVDRVVGFCLDALGGKA